MRAYDNKIAQLDAARRAGFILPRTVIGNDAKFIDEVFADESDLLVKPLHNGTIGEQDQKSQHYIVRTALLPRAHILDNAKRLSNTPMIVQEYIEKDVELRITVVGERIFSAAIHSQDNQKTKIDFRMDADSLKHEVYRLPPQIEKRVRRYMSITDLNFACIDMILTPRGEHVFLESNVNGQWLWVEERTGLPISEAIADKLTGDAHSSIGKV